MRERLFLLFIMLAAFLLSADAQAQIMEPPAEPNVEIRELSHGIIRVVDYDLDVVCYAREYTMSCLKLR